MLREGDAVFLHTGWGDLFAQFPAQNATYNESEPGIGKAAAQWLADQKVVVVGADTWAVEVIPSEDANEAFPVHALLLTNNGIHIIENVRTDLIAAEAASSKRATFFLSMTVPKAVGTDRHLRQYRSDQVVWLQRILTERNFAGASHEAPAFLAGDPRHRLVRTCCQPREARRFRVAFANLNEEPGTSIEGLGFSGAEIRRSFELASRGLPLDMIYYDNGGDAEQSPCQCRQMRSSRKVDLLIEYNSDAEANAEIGRQLKAAGIPVLAVNHPIPDAPLYTADHLAAGRIAGRTLGEFAKENWSDQTTVAAILGDVADPSPFVAARIQGVTEGLRQELPNVSPVLAGQRRPPGSRRGRPRQVSRVRRPGAKYSWRRSTTPPHSLPNRRLKVPGAPATAPLSAKAPAVSPWRRQREEGD